MKKESVFRICAFVVFVCLVAPAPVAGEWQRHTIDDTSIGADGVRMADVNGNGRLDIATGWEEGNLVRIYLQPELDKIRLPWPMVTVGEVASPEDAFFADLDGNGAMDVVSACEGRERTMYVHWAPEDPADYLDESAWTTKAITASRDKCQWMYGRAHDMNGNGRLDIVAGAKNEGAEIGWFESPPNPRDMDAWQWHGLASAAWIMSIEAADIDGDGRVDIVYSERRGDTPGVYWFRAPEAPGGVWERHTIFDTPGHEPMFLTVVQDDDQTVIFTAIKDHGVLRSEKDGDGWRERWYPLPENFGTAKGVATADLFGDGDRSIILSAENARNKRGLVAFSEETGALVQDIGGITGTKFDLVRVVDLTRNGFPDILSCEENEGLGLIWYENPGNIP